jgi:hypothetical protein
MKNTHCTDLAHQSQKKVFAGTQLTDFLSPIVSSQTPIAMEMPLMRLSMSVRRGGY